jgi:cytochrome P450
MHEEPPEDVDWETRAYAGDPRSAYDALRERCPVARSPEGSWMITGYGEVRSCALDAEAFSNRVSTRRQVPNGLDGAEHRRFRALVDGFLTSSRVIASQPTFQAIAEGLTRTLPRASEVDAVWQIGAPLAVRFQCAWLGWPLELEPALVEWMQDHRAAMRGNDPGRRAAVADRFDAFVSEQLRRSERASESSVMTELLEAKVEDPLAEGDRRRLTSAEIVSILRNWTAGDLGTIAACFGVVAFRVATDRALQSKLRAALDEAAVLDCAIDECLRIDDPFLWSRRVATRDVTVAGRIIPAGAKVILNWTAANRDPKRFADPDDCLPEGNAAQNLVYGIGQHVCPGRELATLQLREALAALLRSSAIIRLTPRPPVRACAPMGGYDHVWLALE